MDNSLKGKIAEQAAQNHFIEKGFIIIESNYRCRKAEIDFIAQKDELLALLEVKYRGSEAFGYPEEFVSEAQQSRLIEAADQYLADKKWEGQIRFDIVAVDKELTLKVFYDAFY